VSRIGETFENLRREGSAGYIPYVCMGDPTKTFTKDLVRTLCASGADIVELGLPFSDPVADGPTIQQAMDRSLSHGFRTADTFTMIRALRDEAIQQPFVVMTYYNPILQYGVERFCRDLTKAGGDGILVVDLPLEESQVLDACAHKEGLDTIRLATPNTTSERLGEILSGASGFVYAVSVSGVTGARSSLPSSAKTLIKKVRRASDIPVALGFGISRPDQVEEAVRAGASAVVEGSALINIYAPGGAPNNRSLTQMAKHARKMKKSASM
jgi:tryptophan synthase alpha chain